MTAHDIFASPVEVFAELSLLPEFSNTRANFSAIKRTLYPSGLSFMLAEPEGGLSQLCVYKLYELERAKKFWDHILFVYQELHTVVGKNRHCFLLEPELSFGVSKNYCYVRSACTEGKTVAEQEIDDGESDMLQEIVALAGFIILIQRGWQYAEELPRGYSLAKYCACCEQIALDFCREDERKFAPICQFMQERVRELRQLGDLPETVVLPERVFSNLRVTPEGKFFFVMPLSLEYGLADLNLATLLYYLRRHSGEYKSLLIDFYFNLQTPCRFFQLAALEYCRKLVSDYADAATSELKRKFAAEIITAKKSYGGFAQVVPNWYCEPVVWRSQAAVNCATNVAYADMNDDSMLRVAEPKDS